MALILNRDVCGRRCWACAQEIGGDHGTIVYASAQDIMYLHAPCAQSVSQQLLRDLAQLADLGYEFEEANRQ